MSDDLITLSMEGRIEDDKHVLLPAFVDKLDSLKKMLNQYDAALSGKQTSNFRVVNLSHSSPATIVLQAVPQEEGMIVSETVSGLIDTVKKITSGEVPDNIDYSLLSKFKDFGKGLGTSISYLSLAAGENVAYIGKEFNDQIDIALSEEEVCHGSVEGLLEAINIHDEKNTFNIYPLVGASRVLCHFPSHLHDDAINAVDRKISVTGLLTYRRGEAFPSSVEVSSIEIYPVEDDLPAFDDLFGIAPNATGHLSSEDFIRDLRNNWDA